MTIVTDKRGFGGRTKSQNTAVENFVPSLRWKEDPCTYNLIVDLPGFKKDELKLQVSCSGKMTLSGEREVHEDKIICLEKTFTVPENADMDKITGKFCGGILYVTVPKQVVEERRTDLENVVEMLKKKRGILMTAMLAFSLGVLVTRKLESKGN